MLGEIPKMEIYKFTKKAQLEVYYCESNSVLCENINNTYGSNDDRIGLDMTENISNCAFVLLAFQNEFRVRIIVLSYNLLAWQDTDRRSCEKQCS